MWTQIENSWAAMTGRMRSSVVESANTLTDTAIVSKTPEEVLEEPQALEPDASLVPAPPVV